MCFSLVLVSPLTLSEVRSMLPGGMAADAIGPDAQVPFRRLVSNAHTAVMLRAGRCACRLVPTRFPPPRTDEAHLRDRYRALRASRQDVATALARHRSAAPGPAPDDGALSALVREHARNAGTAAFLLTFGTNDRPPDIPPAMTTRAVGQVGRDDSWLPEDVVTRVVT